MKEHAMDKILEAITAGINGLKEMEQIEHASAGARFAWGMAAFLQVLIEHDPDMTIGELGEQMDANAKQWFGGSS